MGSKDQKLKKRYIEVTLHKDGLILDRKARVFCEDIAKAIGGTTLPRKTVLRIDNLITVCGKDFFNPGIACTKQAVDSLREEFPGLGYYSDYVQGIYTFTLPS